MKKVMRKVKKRWVVAGVAVTVAAVTSLSVRADEQMSTAVEPSTVLEPVQSNETSEQATAQETAVTASEQSLSPVQPLEESKVLSSEKLNQATTVVETNEKPALPAQGTYVFTEDADIKAEPKVSSETLGVYQKGQRVNYDSLVTNDNHQWLSYIGYSGNRRYIAPEAIQSHPKTAPEAPKTAKEEVVAPSKPQLPERGTYQFTAPADIKNEPKMSSQTVGVYQKNQTVNYDKVLVNDSHRWISYVSYSGIRRYIAVEKVVTNPPKVTPKSEVTVSFSAQIVGVSEDGSQAKVMVNGGDKVLSRIRVAAWSEPKQEDLRWYRATNDGTNTASVTIDTTNHRNKDGNYIVHVYTDMADGTVVGRDLGKVSLKHQANATEATVTDQTIELSYKPSIAADTEIRFAVWSEKNDQDDLIWYSANANGQATAPLSKHKAYGTYHIHTYARRQGKMIFLDGKDVEVVVPEVATEVKQLSETQYQVLVTGVPKSLSGLRLPTWSVAQGQDDIKWYNPEKVSEGAYRLVIDTTNHKGDRGDYAVHLYGLSNISGGLVFLKAVEGVSFQHQAPQEKNTVTVEQTQDGLAVQLTSNTIGDFSQVSFAVWSDVNKQDDLKWYKADYRGKALVPYGNHKGLGLYHVHTYQKRQGKMVCLDTTTTTLEEPKGLTPEVTKIDQVTYRVSVKDLPPYVSEVLVPTWTEKNGQDDIVWYKTSKVGDGHFQGTVQLHKHHYETGLYHLHFYARAKTGGNLVFLGKEEMTVDDIGGLSGKLKVTTIDEAKDTFTLSVTNVISPKGLKEVLVPVWSHASGQDDLKWYKAKDNQDGTYQVTVRAADHKYTTGTYSAHLYYRDDLGKLQFVDGTTVTLDVKMPERYTVSVDGKSFTLVGGFAPATSHLKELVKAIRHLEAQGYDMGFVMIDATSRQGIEYRADKSYYAASTIKGPYVASLAAKNPGAAIKEKPTMLAILNYSSNDGYKNLRTAYGSSSLYSWAKEAGLDSSKVSALYPYLTPRDLYSLWSRNYDYFTTDYKGREVGSWFEKPNLSPIHSVLSSSYKTQTKAGWIGGWGYHAANDAGIVYTPKGNYIMSIMSNADGKLGLLNPTVAALNKLHRFL